MICRGAHHDVEAVRHAPAAAKRERIDALQRPQRHLQWALRPREHGRYDVHSDDQVGAHAAHRLRRYRVAHAAVDEDVLAQPERRKF